MLSGHVTVNEAADNIADEAALLEKQTALFFRYQKLQEIFRPLHNNVYMLHALQPSKAAPIKTSSKNKSRG